MIDTILPYAITALVGLAFGGGLMHWLKSRPVTTKAEALKLLAVEANLIARMPSATDAVAQAQAQVAAEALAGQQLAAAIARTSGGPVA